MLSSWLINSFNRNNNNNNLQKITVSISHPKHTINNGAQEVQWLCKYLGADLVDRVLPHIYSTCGHVGDTRFYCHTHILPLIFPFLSGQPIDSKQFLGTGWVGGF